MKPAQTILALAISLTMSAAWAAGKKEPMKPIKEVHAPLLGPRP
ncbi:MAG: hypothetical protein ACK5RO_08755 [Pseudobdellovibrionaceae bacterium]|jgi:hypothetical protein